MMRLHGVQIEDTFAEAFPMAAARAVVTAETLQWARTAAAVATRYGTSVIACDAEAGVERDLAPSEPPDGRPGVSLLLFAFSREKLEKALVGRIGQCVLTCPTTACYNGLPDVPRDKQVSVGGNLRYFGDGWQTSKLLATGTAGIPGSSPDRSGHPPRPSAGAGAPAYAAAGSASRRFWRIPVMDGEFVCEDRFGTVKGVAGGNFLILGRSQAAALAAAERAAAAIAETPEVIAPFPGGIVRSGSKVGSKYKKLRASTNDAYCPTLRGIVETALPEGVNAVYEIVIDGLSFEAVAHAMRAGIRAACGNGIIRISAGNYGGSLGPHHFRLHDVMRDVGK